VADQHPLASGRFDGRVAVVTGAGSGIGRAIVRRFVAEGGRVVAGDIDADRLRELEQELGASVSTLRGDVTNEGDVAALMEAATTNDGALDVAFNVAGASRPALLVDMTEEDWDFTVDLCLKGVFFGIKHAARQMTATGRRGVIVNVASLNSRVPMFFGAAYSAAKAGVVSLGQSAALELADFGIRVATLSPGLTDTPLVQPIMDNAAVAGAFNERIPLKRAASPDEIAAVALFLASDDAAYITGANLFVDGGWEQTAYPDLRPFITGMLDAEPPASQGG
jgi:NAD(P)-dependent dehydrogenase (short-subunit alcohol dehydrogenase family)